MIIGIAIALYGAWEIMGTLNFVNASPGRAKAKFVGYNRETIETRSVSPSPTWPGQQDFHDSSSVMSYPQFEYLTKDGQIRQVQESKIHVIKHFKPGQEYDDIARVLVEGGTNLNKRYSFGDRMRTVGDMAVLARKQELVELMRQRGGTFTQ
jgi:hypothetical protein